MTLTTTVLLSAFAIASPKSSESSPYRFPFVVMGYTQRSPPPVGLQSEQNRKQWAETSAGSVFHYLKYTVHVCHYSKYMSMYGTIQNTLSMRATV